MLDMTKYKFYRAGNKVIAVSSYAGKTVKGIASCDPRDSFDEEKGRQLAAARCNAKIAAKRYRRAQRKQCEAWAQCQEADAYYERMSHYAWDSDRALDVAEEELRRLEMEM